jgi:hypothetical protein
VVDADSAERNEVSCALAVATVTNSGTAMRRQGRSKFQFMWITTKKIGRV